MRSILAFTLATLLAACAHDRVGERWSDTTGARRGDPELARDRDRCSLLRGPSGVDVRERLRPDDFSTARAAAVSCIQSDIGLRTSGESIDSCLKAAGWARESNSTGRN